jgi:NADH:ubiquinone oxidoreductase subunit 6 (subunit J)
MFWILGPLAVVAALGMLLVKKAVHSAILMAFVMIVLAIFYIAQDAAFLGIVQIVVYTGAVMMLFLFILMLVGVDSSDSLTETIRGLRPIAITAAVGFGGLMVSLLGHATLGRGAVGLTHVKLLKHQDYIRTVLAASGTQNGYYQEKMQNDYSTFFKDYHQQFTQTKITLSSTYTRKMSALSSIRTGFILNELGYNLINKVEIERLIQAILSSAAP